MKSPHLIKLLLVLTAMLVVAVPIIHAANNTWSATPSTDLWATTSNWSLGSLNTSDNIIFATSATNTVLTASRTIADMTFNSGASAFTISGTSPGQVITLSSAGGGIRNNSSTTQTINTDLRLSSTPANFTLATAGANNGSLVLNGSYDFSGTPSNQNITLAFGSTTGSTIALNGNLINTGTGGSGVFLTGGSATSMAVFAGNNTGLNAIYMPGNAFTAKLASAGAVASFATIFGGSARGTLWLASDTAINTFGLNNASLNSSSAKNMVILDRATSGAAVNQTLASLDLGKQTTTTFSRGQNVISGTPLVTVSGTTTFSEPVGGGNATILNARDVNLSLGAVTARGNSTTGLNSGLVLDGNSTGNVVTGVIANGTSASTVSSTVSASTSQTVTLASVAGFSAGMTISGTGIASGTVITSISGNTLTLSQSTTSPSGTITGNAVNAANLTKAGSGTWALTGASTYTGVTTVNGGTLRIDFANSSTTTDILYNGFVTSGTGVRPTTTVGGGTLLFEGRAATANVQNLGQIRSQLNNPGAGNVTLTAGSGGTMTVNARSIGSSVNAALNFNLGANTTINFSGATPNSMAGPRVFVNGNDFARYDASRNLIASGTTGYGNGGVPITGSTVMGLNNFSYWLVDGSVERTGITSFSGLKITSSGGTNQSLDLGGFAASAQNGTILYTGGGTGNYTIRNGTLMAENASAEIMFNVVGGATMIIDSTASVADSGALLTTIGQVGDGTLVVSGGKSFTGRAYVNAGTYSFDTIANGNSNSGLGASGNGAANLFIGGTLRYTGAGGSTDRSFTIMGTGVTIDASGSGALTWAPAAALSFLNSANSSTSTQAAQNQTITFTGSNTNANTFGSTLGLLADPTQGLLYVNKSGTGRWVLSGANTYTGSTVVSGGTLELATAGGSAMGATASVTVGNAATLLISTSNQVNDSAAVTLSGGTIRRGSGVTETFGNINLTASSFLDFGTGTISSLNFGTYTGNGFKLNVSNFLEGNVLTFRTDLSGSINNTSLFGFDNAFTSSWNGSTFTITAVPEPSTVLAAVGLGGLLLWPSRRRLLDVARQLMGRGC